MTNGIVSSSFLRTRGVRFFFLSLQFPSGLPGWTVIQNTTGRIVQPGRENGAICVCSMDTFTIATTFCYHSLWEISRDKNSAYCKEKANTQGHGIVGTDPMTVEKD